MESNKALEELEGKYEELAKDYKAAREEVMLFEEDPQYAEYNSTNDEERKEKFPAQYAMYEREAELSQKLDSLAKDIVQAAQNLHKDLDAAIGTFKERIEQNQRTRDELEQETIELRAQLKELKKTPEYKDREEAALEQVEDIQVRLKRLAAEKGKLTKSINMFKREIDGLEEKKAELVLEYGDQIIVKQPDVAQISPEEDGEKDKPEDGNEVVEQEEQEIVEESEQVEEQETEEQKQIQTLILNLEKELAECSDEYQQAMEEIRTVDKEIIALKNTEEYKNGDEATLAKVKKLEQDLATKVIAKNEIVTKLKDIRNKINQVKAGRVTIDQQEEDKPIKNSTPPKKPIQEQQNEGEPATRPYRKQNYTHLTGYQTGYGDAYTSYISEPQSNSTPDEQQEPTEKYTKKDFNKLCSKAKKRKLTQEEFNKLAEIMKDEQSYDKFGITTGIVLNKSKSVLKSMALMTADTGKTAWLSRERLGLAAEKANEENGYLSTASIREWKGLKTLMDDPGRKIASEELFKEVVKLDRASLTDEQKEVWDRANEHLGRFHELKSCLQAYQNVSEKRREKSMTWLRKQEEAKPLPETTTPPENPLSSNLEGLVKDTPDDSEIKPRTTDAPTREK